MINVEVKVNYESDELFCFECKNRINLNEKYIIVIEQLYDGEIIKKPTHLDCVEETFDEEQDDYFFSPT
jgi:hypothetical protein